MLLCDSDTNQDTTDRSWGSNVKYRQCLESTSTRKLKVFELKMSDRKSVV